MHNNEDNDLVRLADLMILTAKTAELFSDKKSRADGKTSRISELADQVHTAAMELRRIGLDKNPIRP